MLSWEACPGDGAHPNAAHADLDLWIKDSSGTIVAAGQSYDQTYEILELPAAAAGVFTIYAKKYAWSWCNTFGLHIRYGFAYDIH